MCLGGRPLQVSLIVLDSATFHFRQDFTDAAQRSRLLLAMAQQLAQVAEQRGVAIVMVNQVGLSGQQGGKRGRETGTLRERESRTQSTT